MMRRREVLAGALAIGGCASMPRAQAKPLVIGHRGACGERPEHTMGSYRLAIAEGADYIEPDLVMTRDGVLVCRHENEISATTNVADHGEFARRRTIKLIDGETVSGWFVEDFTLAELSVLRCRERLPQLRPANRAYDDQEPIPTFEDVLALARAEGVGIYPELKHPSFLAAHGLDPVEPLVAALNAAGWNGPDAPVFAQCFEVYPLVRLATLSAVRKVLLIGAEAAPLDLRDEGATLESVLSDDGLKDIAAYAFAIGVDKSLVIPRGPDAASLAPTDLAARAHRIGLAVHAWTFRAENAFLPAELRRGEPSAPNYQALHGDLRAELAAFFGAGVDGVFCDFPSIARAAADQFAGA
jgi:glycerophosphoryl diester phosphodiesterase